MLFLQIYYWKSVNIWGSCYFFLTEGACVLKAKLQNIYHSLLYADCPSQPAHHHQRFWKRKLVCNFIMRLLYKNSYWLTYMWIANCSVFIVQTISIIYIIYMHCNFTYGLSDVRIKTFSQSVSVANFINRQILYCSTDMINKIIWNKYYTDRAAQQQL